MIVWGVTGGAAGMEAQVMALARTLELQPLMKRIVLPCQVAWIPNSLFPRFLLRRLLPEASLIQPWPELIISCGRRSALVALGLRSLIRSRGHKPPALIHIQDPQMNPSHFDLVIAMQHDRIEGKNVYKTQYALHSVIPERLAEARERFAKRFERFPSPRIVVLIGGSTNKYIFTADAMLQVIESLKQIWQGSLLITASRRTGEENLHLLNAAFDGNPNIYVYDGESENPYMGLLALADAIIVSDDSVNMMSEAHATGKPLYLMHLAGHEKTKPASFAARLIESGHARAFHGVVEPFLYDAGDEMQKVAAWVRERLSGLPA